MTSALGPQFRQMLNEPFRRARDKVPDKPYHEMSREEFERQPGTLFHGNPVGNFGVNQPTAHYGFHVGTRRAAEDAVGARAGYGRYSSGEEIPAPLASRGDEFKAEAVRGGRLNVEMTNQLSNPHGDYQANGYMAGQIKRGRARRGYFYENVSEDEGSVSAVLPTRQSFKTHEDYLVEAIAKNKAIPSQALKGYSQIPGQEKLL